MLAIGWSMVNRVGFRNNGRLPFGSTLHDVIYQPRQYSSLDNGGSPAWRRSANPANIPDPAVWAQAVAAANAILSGRAADPSGGAHYFFASPSYNPNYARTAKPGFPEMLRTHHYVPTPFQSGYTFRDRHGQVWRNYFFRENAEKLMDPPPSRR
jgi:hypothetical protein